MSPITIVQNELFGDQMRPNILRTQTHARYRRLQKVDPGHDDLNDPKYYNALSKRYKRSYIKVTNYLQ